MRKIILFPTNFGVLQLNAKIVPKNKKKYSQNIIIIFFLHQANKFILLTTIISFLSIYTNNINNSIIIFVDSSAVFSPNKEGSGSSGKIIEFDSSTTDENNISNKKINLGVGERLTLKMWGNPVTGNVWVLDPAPDNSCLYDIYKTTMYKPDNTLQPNLGGTWTFKFDAVKCCETTFTVYYRRTFAEDSSAAEESYVNLDVKVSPSLKSMELSPDGCSIPKHLPVEFKNEGGNKEDKNPLWFV